MLLEIHSGQIVLNVVPCSPGTDKMCVNKMSPDSCDP